MAARYPQLQLNLSSNNTSFKRSFDELGLDLDSPADEQSSSGSGENSSRSTDGNIDRHKRARSESDSSDVGGTVNGNPSASQTSASGVASTSSGSSLSAFVAGVLPAHETAAASHVGGSYSGLMLDGSEASVSPMEGIEFTTPLSLETALVSPPITVAPVSPPAPSGHSERYRISMERFNAFDSNISVLRHSASPVPEPIPPRTSRDRYETRSVDAPSSTPEDTPPLAQRLPDSFASDTTSPFDSRPRVPHRTSSPSMFPLLSSVAPHPVPSTPASQLDIAPWLDAEFMDPWRSTSPTLPQVGRTTSHISGPPDSRPGYINASYTHNYNRTSNPEALPTFTSPRPEHVIDQRHLAALREVRIALTSPLDGNELSDNSLQASDIRDGPNQRSWVDRAAESGRLPPPAIGVGQSRYESTLRVLPMRPLGRLWPQSHDHERTRQEALLRLNRLNEIESSLLPQSRNHDTVNEFPSAGPRSTSDARELSDGNPRASWAHSRVAQPTGPHDSTFAGRRRSPSPDPQAQELALLQQFIEDLRHIVTTRRALAAWDNESERDDSADSRLAHARAALNSRNDEHSINVANGIFPPDLHQTSNPPLRGPVAAGHSSFSRPPSDNHSVRGRMSMSSHLYSTRPGPSNSLMSENAAERRRRTAREHLIPSLAESGLITGERDFPRDGPTRSPDIDTTFGWFGETAGFAPATQGSTASRRGQLNHGEENLETGGQREEGTRRQSIADAEFAARYWGLSPPTPVVRVRSSGDRNSSRGDTPGVAMQTSGDTHTSDSSPYSSGVDFWRYSHDVDAGTTAGASNARPRPFNGLADRRSISGSAPSLPRPTPNPLGHGLHSRPSHLSGAAVPSSNEAAALFASEPSFIHGSNSLDLFALEVNRRRRSSRLAVLRRLRADSTSDGDASPTYASSGVHQSSADPTNGRIIHSQDPMEFYLNDRPESPSSFESSADLSTSPPSYPSRAEPLGPAHLLPRDLISPREFAATRTSARRFHDLIDLDSFHDGPFRATLERSVEMDRQRQARHLGSNIHHRGSEASVLPPIHSEQEARSAASVGSLPPIHSLPRLVSRPPDPQSANNTTTRSSWRTSWGDVTERPIQRSQLSLQQRPVGSEWSESNQARYSENYDQTSQAENLGRREPLQRMTHRDRASQQSHLHVHGPVPPLGEERHLSRQDFVRQAPRRRSLDWPRPIMSMGDNEDIESRGRRRNDSSSGIFTRSNGDGSSRPMGSLQPQARDRAARLVAPTGGSAARVPMANAFHDFMDMLPSPPRHAHSPSVSPTRDNDGTAEARAAHARSSRMRATRRRHAELIGHDAMRGPTDLSRFGFMPPFASFRGRSIGDYVRDEDLDTSYEGLLHLSTLLGEVRPRGTPDHIVSSLPSGLYKEWAKPGETEQRCPICLDDYQEDDPVLKVADCTHWFHKSCLEQWLKTARTCPVCRGRVGGSTRHAEPFQHRTQTTGANRSMSGAFTTRRLGTQVGHREPTVRNDHAMETNGDEEGVQTPRLRNTPPWRSE